MVVVGAEGRSLPKLSPRDASIVRIVKAHAVHASAWAACVSLQMSSAGRPQHISTPRPLRTVYRMAPTSQKTKVIDRKLREVPILAEPRLSALVAAKAMYMKPKNVVQQAVKRRKLTIWRYRNVGNPVLVKWSIRDAVTPISAIAKSMRMKYMMSSIIFSRFGAVAVTVK